MKVIKKNEDSVVHKKKTIDKKGTDGKKNKVRGESNQDKFGKDVKYSNSHARLGEQEQEEWLNNEKLSIESKRRESPFLTRRDKFKKEFMRRIIPWEMINISWDTFPYHIQ